VFKVRLYYFDSLTNLAFCFAIDQSKRGFSGAKRSIRKTHCTVERKEKCLVKPDGSAA